MAAMSLWCEAEELQTGKRTATHLVIECRGICKKGKRSNDAADRAGSLLSVASMVPSPFFLVPVKAYSCEDRRWTGNVTQWDKTTDGQK